MVAKQQKYIMAAIDKEGCSTVVMSEGTEGGRDVLYITEWGKSDPLVQVS